jgi:DHA2 family multidrug resistance protein
MMFTGAAQVFLAPIASWMVQRMAARLVLVMGLVILVASLFAHGDMTADMGLGDLAFPQFIRGLGMMLCFMPITVVAIGSVPLNDVRTASSLFNLFRSLGGAVALALITTTQEFRFNFHYDRMIATLLTGDLESADTLVQLRQRIEDVYGFVPSPDTAALEVLSTILEREVWVLTFNDMWLALAVYCGCAALMLPFLPDRVRPQAD